MPELLAEQKKRKTALLAHQFVIGLMAGIAVFSVVSAVFSLANKGFGFFSLGFPLLFLLIFVRNGKGLKASLQRAQAEVKSRSERASH